MNNDQQSVARSGSLERMVRRYGPWLVKQRPAGDWVVDQIDRETMRVRRYGPYKTYPEAEAKWLDLTSPNADISDRR